MELHGGWIWINSHDTSTGIFSPKSIFTVNGLNYSLDTTNMVILKNLLRIHRDFIYTMAQIQEKTYYLLLSLFPRFKCKN